jgi:WD40 repeat protein
MAVAGCAPAFHAVRFETHVLRAAPRSVAFHPKDPTRLLVVDETEASLWDLRDSKKWTRLATFDGASSEGRFSVDGKTVATAVSDGTVRLWNLDGTPRGEPLRGHRDRVLSVAFSPGGDLVASAGADGSLRIWKIDGSPRGDQGRARVVSPHGGAHVDLDAQNASR